MLSRTPTPLKPRLHQFRDFFGTLDELFRDLFLPRGSQRRRNKRQRRLVLGAITGLQPLEPRLLLTGPTANPDTYYDNYNDTINIPAYAGVLANDSGGDGPLSAVLVSQPSAGTLTLNSDGSLVYTNTFLPMGSSDSFTYEAYDGANYSAPATVTINFGDN